MNRQQLESPTTVGHAETIDERLPIVWTGLFGTLAGLVAAIIGYLATYAWLGDRGLDILVRHAGRFSIARDVLPTHSGAITDWQAVGWLFFNAHGEGVRFALAANPQSGANYVDFLGAEGGLIGALWLVPGVILIGAGVLVAYTIDVHSPGAGVIAGGSVAIGYVVALVLIRPALVVEVGRWEIAAGGSLLGIAGMPLVCGGLGGLIAAALD